MGTVWMHREINCASMGHKCTFRTNIEQKEMNCITAAIISAMVRDERFKEAVKRKIETAVDTTSSMIKQAKLRCRQKNLAVRFDCTFLCWQSFKGEV